MGIISSFKVRKSINLLLSSSNLYDPQVVQAITYLKEAGPSAIPKLLDTLENKHTPDTIKQLLTMLARDDTLPLYMKELEHSNAQKVAGIANILSDSKTYNPNHLIDYCTNSKVSQTALTQILTHHKDRLGPQVIQSLLARMDKDSRTSILRFVEQAATKSMIPVLLPWLQTDDWITRLSVARILGRFPTREGESALLQLLGDPHKSIRQTALEGLSNINNPDHVGAVCKLIRDNDLSVQNKAIETVVRMKAPHTVPHLLELLQDESEYVRRGAVEVLNAVADTSAIKDLLGVLRDQDWWVRVRAADALGTIGGPAVVEAVLDLMQDEDPFIRRSAVEILNTTSDDRTFDALVNAVANDPDWWVRERAIDALAQLGDTRAVPVLLPLLSQDTEAARVAIRALATIGDPSAIYPLIGMLQSSDRGVVKEALQALSALTQEGQAADVQQSIAEVKQRGDASVSDLAKATLKVLVQRLGDRVGTLTSAASFGASQSQIMQSVDEANLAAMGAAAPQEVLSVMAGTDPNASQLDMTALEPGMMLKHRYRVLRHVGKGAFGSAVLVEDTAVRENIVLKFLHPHLAATEQTVKRFVRELRYSRRITHENVIRIYDFLTFGQSYAISMEYFESHALAAYLQGGVRIAPRTSLKLLQSICSGMQAAHQAEVIHRDLKPANVLVNREGALKIVDFGLAAAADFEDSRVTRSGAMVGTPAYMSPEQIRGEELDARTDIYSLGIIMYEMFTGQQPYRGKDTVSVIYQHIQGNFAPPSQVNPEISPAIEAIILKAMSMEAKNRFQSMDAVREALNQVERL
jgi:eukaryotic-like serine/threonine-protein kinase